MLLGGDQTERLGPLGSLLGGRAARHAVLPPAAAAPSRGRASRHDSPDSCHERPRAAPLTGPRRGRYTLAAGDYNCRAFEGDHLQVPSTAAPGACALRCKGGERIAMPAGTGAPGALARPACVQCPANHFSLGGGELIRDWGLLDPAAPPAPRAPSGSAPGWGTLPRPPRLPRAGVCATARRRRRRRCRVLTVRCVCARAFGW
jgi:hypothetical protein